MDGSPIDECPLTWREAKREVTADIRVVVADCLKKEKYLHLEVKNHRKFAKNRKRQYLWCALMNLTSSSPFSR